MRKLMVAAAVAAVSTLGFVGRADAQAFYPKTPKAPARVQGAYSYPGQYPSYPGQYPEYPTTSRARRDAGRHVKRDRDGDDDDRSRYGAQNRYDPRSSYGYGSRTTGLNSAPSRVADHEAASRSSSRWNDNHRDDRWNSNRRGGR